MGQNNKPLRAGELARLAAVSSDTLRHYERIGILPKAPRTASGYRMYPPDSLARVNLVQTGGPPSAVPDCASPIFVCRSFPPPRAY
jgi:hypothetical protein